MRIVSSNKEASHAYVAGQHVELWCQLSRLAAPVHWYKDGEEVEAGESLVLEQEGLQCRLVLPCAQPQDTGEFVCDAGGDSVFYTITVAGGCNKHFHPSPPSPSAPAPCSHWGFSTSAASHLLAHGLGLEGDVGRSIQAGLSPPRALCHTALLHPRAQPAPASG